jgi:hypothetical protein
VWLVRPVEVLRLSLLPVQCWLGSAV